MSKKEKKSDSLSDLGKLLDMEKTAGKKTNEIQPMNFYSFLHKRNRFYENDVVKVDRKYDKRIGGLSDNTTIIHDKFHIKKIDVHEFKVKRIPGRDGMFKEEIEYFSFDKGFNWLTSNFFKNLIVRHEDNAQHLSNEPIKKIRLKPDWRLTIGLGGGSVFETSISLHHIYGFPYLPSTSIKGVVRSFLITSFWGTEKNCEAKAFNESQAMCDIFGCPETISYKDDSGVTRSMDCFYMKSYREDKQNFGNDKTKYRFNGITEKSGDIIFFDAYPTESPKDCIKTDIMNPHYPKYYNGDLPPADWQSPIPIIFLTVVNLRFQFMVGLRKGVENKHIDLGDQKQKPMLDVVEYYLKQALEEHGIGAKTAVGYGYMEQCE